MRGGLGRLKKEREERTVNKRILVATLTLAVGLSLVNGAVWGELRRGTPAPDIRAVDIAGQSVDLDAIMAENPYLVIVYCFSPAVGEDLAARLQGLQMRYGREKLQVIALGIEQDEEALQAFARRLGIRYHIVNATQLEDSAWLQTVRQFPMTLFVETTETRRIDQILAGDGLYTASLLTEIAETLFRQRREEALEIVEEAISEGDDRAARELRGYILASDGKLDDAEEEFGSLESHLGLAKVALSRGEFERAITLADQAGDDPYAAAIKAEALARLGKIDDAATTVATASTEEAARPWQAAEIANSRGRVKHQLGDIDGAVSEYRVAREIDGYGVKPLSNEAVALREQGHLEEAEQLLAQAQRVSDDDLVATLLLQVRDEREAANDLRRQELIRTQIQSLSKRYRELKEEGLHEPADAWSTRPLTLALLPGRHDVFFERAGTDIALQRGLEARLQADPRVQVLERTMLEYLLQELELGASELADPNTQQVLGQVLAAQYLGFVDYAQVGADPVAYVRLVDTETTALAMQTSQPVRIDTLENAAQNIVERILAETADSRELRGLVADVTDDIVMVNIGSKHGAALGQRFDVFTDGDPIEVGGRTIAHRQNTIGRIEITDVEEDYSLAEIVVLRENAAIEPEMKIRISTAPPSDDT